MTTSEELTGAITTITWRHPQERPHDGLVDSPPATATDLLCGKVFHLPVPGRLIVSGDFPTTVPAGGRAISGSVEVRSQEIIRGVAAPGADMFLVRDACVVTEPVVQDSLGIRWDLEPGTIQRLPGFCVLTPCAPDGGSLVIGDYLLFARVVVALDDGTRLESFGGPWPLSLI